MATRLDAEYGKPGALFFSVSFYFCFYIISFVKKRVIGVPFGDVGETHKNSFKRFKHLTIICRIDDRCSHYPDL